MKYFVTSDTHGFYNELVDSLTKAGFDRNNDNHKLIICGDLMDRGSQALLLQDYVLSLMDKNKVILIKGNHEDLILEMIADMIHDIDAFKYGYSYHISNGTFDTALQLTKFNYNDAINDAFNFIACLKQTAFIKTIIPHMVDYFETNKYIFTHGWIPCKIVRDRIPILKNPQYEYCSNWRNADKQQWDIARWSNGMKLHHEWDIKEPGKTIVCGHWNTSFGHSHYEHDGEEFGSGANFLPFYDNGIISIDACTAYSKKINFIVIED